MTPGPGLHRTPLPKGFLASGANCGVRKYRPDIGVIISEVDAVAAGVFTLNECKAAPVQHCAKVLPADNVRAIFTNSGQANAATGAEGFKRNQEVINATAEALKCTPEQVLIASTGVIGVQMHTDKIIPALPDLVERAQEHAESFALAILTTDLVPKTVTTAVKLSQGEIRITGICKGSGMIHPNMATMLGYILTDVKISKDVAHTVLKAATDVSFNMISVDGDSSTNDCCFLMANGEAGVELKNDQDYNAFKTAVTEVMVYLAKSIAADGEGATKLIEVAIKGSPEEQLAKTAARGVTLSPLIKTAIHGEDPNWGRILARLGAEKVPAAALAQMDLTLQGIKLFTNGEPATFNKDEVRQLLKSANVKIEIDLKSGPYSATAWGCDLSKKYVDINTDYS